ITRGTDDVFLKLMKVSGSSLLKLFGIPAAKAEKYHFHAVVLKDKSLKPDIEGFPLLKSEKGRIFIEFQGYKDPFIRHRLMAEVFLGCAGEEYQGSVMAGIVYTDKKYQKAAKPLNAFNGFEKEECHLKGCFREIVLTDYTEEQLEAIDPKLIVLAPFTLSDKTDKTTLLAKGREWQKALTQRFPVEKHGEVLSALGLLILNRFREITYEEVIAMLKFDLMDTVAGRQLYDMGRRKERVNTLQETVLDALEARFELVP
ncbi:MAG: DUF2887 domain-containing protein, partial [Desulfobacteraceae bacterium]|nr:DUF2887 domain-containing protein [Desulfobacteraceae bacterium]